MYKNSLSNFSIEGKTPEEKEIFNISDSWLEISFLRNLNTLVGILFASTDLVESKGDMTFSVSVLSVGITKKEILNVFLKKSEKCLCDNEISRFVLLAIEEK